MSVSLVIAAGGTGGHLIPALAIADTFRAAAPDARITFVGTPRGMESELVPAAGYPLRTTSVKPFRRSAAAGIAAAASTVPATIQARRVLRDVGADIVLGMGGYPSLPVVAAARTLHLPILLHEQNAIPGLANELGARVTPHVAVSFPATVSALRGARLVGLPIRRDLGPEQLASARASAPGALDLAADRHTVLIFGGSLGAVRLNDAAVELAEAWRDRDDVQLLVATGRAHVERVAAAMPSGKLLVRIEPYLARMDLAYAVADVAVCRAGASTVHELAMCGLPSVLVPFPHARRREQHANARMLVEAGAAELIEDEALTGELLASHLDALLADEDARARTSAAARSVAMPGAAEEMVAWLLRLVRS